MTPKELAKAAKAAAQKTTMGYRIRPHSPLWNEVMWNLDAIILGEPPPPPPPPPPPEKRYAPKAYNSTSRADARFCMAAEYGVTRDGLGYIDEMGVRYDEGGRDLGGRSTDQVPGLKGADSMDGLEPCDSYTKDGRGFPPYPVESFNR